MAVNERIFNCLSPYGGGTLDERMVNYLGSLDYKGPLSEKLSRHTYLKYEGYQALMEQTRVICDLVPPGGMAWDSGQTWDGNTYWR